MKYFLILISLAVSLAINAQSFFVSKTANEVIIQKQYITIGYNTQYLIPNYVGETLIYSMTVGNENRLQSFYTEEALPKQYRTKSSQYTKTGYDRGHLAPAADFKFSKQAMYDSFSMANVAPQYPKVNRGCWEELEEFVRELSSKVDTLFIITGTVVEDVNHKLGQSKIVVPTYFYKAVLGKCRNIYKISCAWFYCNDKTCKHEQITINELERKIHRNLFVERNDERVESKILLQQ